MAMFKEMFTTIIPETEVIIYLGIHFEFRFNWKEHIAKKENKST